MANSVCFGMELQRNSQKRETQAANDNIDELLHVHMLPVFIGYLSWIASVAPVPRPSVSMYLGALTDHTQWTPKRKHDEKAAFSRCQMAWRVAVSAGSTSANVHSEFSKRCSTVSTSATLVWSCKDSFAMSQVAMRVLPRRAPLPYVRGF